MYTRSVFTVDRALPEPVYGPLTLARSQGHAFSPWHEFSGVPLKTQNSASRPSPKLKTQSPGRAQNSKLGPPARPKTQDSLLSVRTPSPKLKTRSWWWLKRRSWRPKTQNSLGKPWPKLANPPNPKSSLRFQNAKYANIAIFSDVVLRAAPLNQAESAISKTQLN